jgi:hypothetical protein
MSLDKTSMHVTIKYDKKGKNFSAKDLSSTDVLKTEEKFTNIGLFF